MVPWLINCGTKERKLFSAKEEKRRGAAGKKTHVGMAGLLLDDLLHLSVILAGRFGKFGRSFLHQQLSLGRLIVFLTEYPSQFLVYFYLLSRDVGPNVFESVDWVRLQS